MNQPPTRETFADVLLRLFQERYTGSVVLHFGEGVAASMEIPAPSTKIRLTRPSNSATLSGNS